MSEYFYKQKPLNAVLNLKTTQRFPDGEEDQNELNSTVHYCYRPEQAEITYSETEDNSEDESSTIITVTGNSLVTIQKNGFAEGAMILEPGKTHALCYRTPFGDIEMLVRTFSIRSTLRKEGGALLLDYQLEFQPGQSSVNTVDLSITLR